VPKSDAKRADSKLLDVFEGLEVGAFSVEPGHQGQFRYFNDALLKMSGYTRQELEALPVSELYPDPTDREEFEQEIQRTGHVHSKTLRLVNKRGKSVYVQITAVARRGRKTRAIESYDGILLDVTKEIELRDLVEALNAVVYRNRKGPKGRFVYFNDALIKLTGYSREELKRMPVSKLYSNPADRDEFERELKSNGTVHGRRIHLLGNSGQSIYGEVTAIARPAGRGKGIAYYDGIVLDVTGEVEVYANISHQIRTPILGIKHSVMELLDGDGHDRKTELLLKSIRGCSNIALFLTRHLNYISKILEMSRDSLVSTMSRRRLTPTIMKLVIDLQEYARQTSAVSIHVDTESLDELPEVMFDDTAIQMAAFCLLDNAIKYSFERTTVTVFGCISKRYVNVCIRNTGLPIRGEQILRVFEKRYRTPEARAFVGGGTGLGLYFAKRIMLLHGGDVLLDASSGDVTEFRLAFPKAATSAEGSM